MAANECLARCLVASHSSAQPASGSTIDSSTTTDDEKRSIAGVSTIEGDVHVALSAVVQSNDEWKKVLTEAEYHVLREKATEPEGTGEYDDFHPVDGYFTCRGCGNPLFSSDAKFKSGCGWPSFDRCYVGSIVPRADFSHGGRRVEIVCVRCEGHLGHLFSGEHLTEMNQRHCVNSLSIRFVKEPPSPSLVERGEAKVSIVEVEKVLAATSSDGKLANIRPQSDLDLSDPALVQVWHATRSLHKGWCLCSYAANSSKRIVPIAQGGGGYAELRAALVAETVNYGVLPATVDGRLRHVFFCYGACTRPLVSGLPTCMHCKYVLLAHAVAHL
jgi:peptide-methionine (R)-S-oxide reductase